MNTRASTVLLLLVATAGCTADRSGPTCLSPCRRTARARHAGTARPGRAETAAQRHQGHWRLHQDLSQEPGRRPDETVPRVLPGQEHALPQAAAPVLRPAADEGALVAS